MKRLNLNDVRGSAQPAAVDIAAVEEVERLLRTSLPDGYREFICRFGASEFCGFLYVPDPEHLREKNTDVQRFGVFESASELWRNFDDIFREVSPKDLVVLATSIDGDELVFVSGKPDSLYVFPRHDNQIHGVGPNFLEALAWFAFSGVLVEPVDEPYVN